MKRVRVLKVDFDQQLRPYEISKFRGAIINKTQRGAILFHNHIGEEKFRYAYPLIQYKSIRGKASMICIDEGTEEIHTLFRQSNMDILLGDNPVTLRLSGLKANYFNIQVTDQLFHYELYNWIGLNSDNYKRYQKMDSEVERIQLIEKVLIGNLLALASGVDLQVSKPIKVTITQTINQKLNTYKNTKMMGFDIQFRSNFFIPNFLGLGKGASIGYGTVMSKRKKAYN